ncbi:MAG: hypothetical protein OEY57_02620 [Nitrospirota bacterium]|nr:hypothetical protein [Nitrospirota bacterium]
MNNEKLIEKAERLIKLGGKALKTNFVDSHHTVWVSSEIFGQFRSSSLSYLRKVFGENHPHYLEFNEKVTRPYKSTTDWGIGIIKAAKNEIESGWVESLKGIVSSELFSSFLEMAEYLLQDGYKDPSAVMIGSVLEQHLRALSIKYELETTRIDNKGNVMPLKADLLNINLAKKEILSKLDSKNVRAWLDLRNEAAHGNYDQYNVDQVKTMCMGVGEFMARIKL